MKTLVVVALVALAVLPAHADTVYTYTSDTFHQVSGDYTTTDRITGSFTLMDSFIPSSGAPYTPVTEGVLAWSFTDGHQTLTQGNASARARFMINEIAVLQSVAPIFWNFRIDDTSTGGAITSIRFGQGIYTDDVGVGVSSSGRNYCDLFCSDGSVAGTWTVQTISVPELAILPRLPRVLKFGPGLGLEAKVTRALQRATAWTAAAILRAPREGVTIRMPHVAVEVAEACSGLQTLLLMLGAAGLIVAVKSGPLAGVKRRYRILSASTPGRGRPYGRPDSWGWNLPTQRAITILLFFAAAVLLALEANALRVAGIAMGLEYLGAMTREAKDWIQIATTGLALGQLVGIGRLASAAVIEPSGGR